MRLIRSAALCSLILFVASCAQPVAPGGGPPDIHPPALLSSKPSNYSTSFNEHDIRLDFDEYVNVDNIASQLIVSPLLKNQPEIKVRGKTLLIHFDDTLLANTTYTMNFGNALVDNNEGNKLEDFQFVFSTGAVIDSLSIRGKIKNAFDLKIEKGVLVMLYKNSDDSLPFKERPVYFGKTNDSGYYQVSNISPNAYKVIGLKEADGNYLYFPGEEMIGFSDSLIEANSEGVDLRMFKENLHFQLLKSFSEFPGKAVLVFNGRADTLRWKWISDTTKLDIYSVQYSPNKDSIIFWYKNVLVDSLNLRFDNDKLRDTVQLRLFKKQEGFPGRKSIAFKIEPAPTESFVHHIYLPYMLLSNHPIVDAAYEKIRLLEDSVVVKPAFSFSDSIKTRFNIKHPWKGNSKYSLFIPPGTFTDVWGEKNDTIEINFVSHRETDYGTVKINFLDSDNKPYLIQLIDDGEKVYREMRAEKNEIFELINLDPKIYRLKLVHDSNNNGIWDTGNYLLHLQPEVVEYFPDAITIRANWDVEISIRAPLSASLKN